MGFGVEIGLRNVVEDLSPQSGGDWDVNGFKIISLANGNIVLAPNGTGYVYLDSDLYVTGAITGEHIIVSSPTPILVLKDSTYVGDDSLGFTEWRDANNTRLGFFGNSSSGDADLLWKNESSGGHIKLQTTGAGNFAFIAGLAGLQVSGTYHERLNVGGNLGFDTVAEITSGQKDAMEAGLSEDVGGTLAAGEYHYDIRFDTVEGSSKPIYVLFGEGAIPDITVAENAKVVMVDLPVSADPRVVSRTIYRTPNPGDTGYLARPIYTINDNSTTTWTDDGSLTPSGSINYAQGNDTAGAITVANTLFYAADEYTTKLGYKALHIYTSYSSVAIGQRAGEVAISGSGLTLVGDSAGLKITTGNTNTCLGQSAGRHIPTGFSNTFVGAYCYGHPAGADTDYNTYVGKDAGYGAMRSSSDHGNTCVGAKSSYNFGGAYNVIMGYQAGKLAAGQTANNYNVILGALCGQNLAGATNNIIIGYNIDLDAPGDDYKLNIGDLIKGDLVNKTVELDAALTLLERGADPDEPAEGECVLWMSDGTGKGDDGDVLVGSKAGGVAKWAKLLQHAGGSAW